MQEELYFIKIGGQPQTVVLQVNSHPMQKIRLDIYESLHFSIDDVLIIRKLYPSLTISKFQDDKETVLTTIDRAEIEQANWESLVITALKQIASAFQGEITRQSSGKNWEFYAYKLSGGERFDMTQEAKKNYL
jgi:hypothetical protein